MVYTSQKTHTSAEGEVRYRLCGNAPESVAHILSGWSMLAQSKSLSRYNAVLKELFYQLLYDKRCHLGTHPTSPSMFMSQRKSKLIGMSLYMHQLTRGQMQ